MGRVYETGLWFSCEMVQYGKALIFVFLRCSASVGDGVWGGGGAGR